MWTIWNISVQNQLGPFTNKFFSTVSYRLKTRINFKNYKRLFYCRCQFWGQFEFSITLSRSHFLSKFLGSFYWIVKIKVQKFNVLGRYTHFSKMSVLRDSPTLVLFTFLYAFQGFCFGTTQTLFLYLKKAGFEYADIAILAGIIKWSDFDRTLLGRHSEVVIDKIYFNYSDHRTSSIRFLSNFLLEFFAILCLFLVWVGGKHGSWLAIHWWW